MKILIILSALFFSSLVIAEGFASWGNHEDKCENTIEIIKLAEKLGEPTDGLTKRIIRGNMQGYMSGINNWIYDEFGMYKHLNYNTIEHAFSYLINYCEKNPNKKVVDGILEYIVQLPFIEN